uniref:Uncharacterized protein n=1 Tax=Tanacetum cinerariifolium TaxID=118510 RepID=A0A699GQH5_TANCI|nr:hypothetical protein [Tanacetum cinerariifolium]
MSSIPTISYRTAFVFVIDVVYLFSRFDDFRNSRSLLKKYSTATPVVETCKAKSSEEEPKVVRNNDDAPIIKEWVSDNEEEDVSQPKIEKKIVRPSIAKTEFVKSKQQEKIARKIVKQVEQHRQTLTVDCNYHQKQFQNQRIVKPVWSNAQRVNHQNFAKKTHPCAKKNMVPRSVLMKSGLVSISTARQNISKIAVLVNTIRQVNAAHLKIAENAARSMSYLSKTSHSTVKRLIHKNTTFKNSNINQRVNTVRGKKFNTARPKEIVNVVKENNSNAVKASACNPQIDLQDQGVIDSGCSRHMTGNMSYLIDYEEIDGGGTINGEAQLHVKGRRINVIDPDEDITLVSAANKEMFNVDVLGGKEVFVDGQNENVVKDVVVATKVSTASTTVTITTKEITLAQALKALKTSNPRAFRMVNTFEDFRIKFVEGKEKRAREELVQEITKKQKVEDDKEKTELKQLMETIPDDKQVAIDVIPLAIKSLRIVDWKIHKEGKKSYYQIVRADGKSQMYKIFSQMLKSFNKEDLEDLYKLVKARYGSTRLVESIDYLLWNDMKIIFEPHIEDEVWKMQQGYKVLEWNLYDSCRVHSLQSMQIYMLIEKKYPLTPPTLLMMLEKKLIIDYENKMAYQLLKLIKKQLKN